ncbi:UDP-glucose 4-epimerase GalE [Defluviitalea saccharophila]|uniref:UDP-glucose 4-epimerase n=1 Tax=Defluviitalea saccharophila TaxID=879970 RepID=A0ABZ2YAI6_9FIRM|nr:UDP-glucose 4-epimerase GalE [Candidatus Epulonipiscium sp.]
MRVLVTGGAGYIGSHTCIRLIENGFDIVIADNLYNSKTEAIKRVEKIVGRKLKFYHADMCNRAEVEEIFQNEQIDAVIHFAAYKAVGESVAIPLRYYDNNIQSAIVVLETMQKYGVKNFVFSSSATVYGLPKSVPIREDFPLSATNPYGQTKLMIEQILRDVHHAAPDMNIAILRYFNPIGAHESGLIGEDPKGIPNNLVPYITQVAVGKLKKLQVFGGDYETKDGTGVRDYIHVLDLADGHVAALNKLKQNCGLVVYNLGTGTGYSVLEMIHAFEKVSGRNIPFEIVARRPGDIAQCYADPAKAKNELNWEAKFGLEKMCEDSWRWQLQNPNGYEE